MTRKYSDCFYCEGVVEERLMPREIRWHGKLFIIEGVPMGVCKQCGEKFIMPEVAKDIDRILEEKEEPAKIVQIPVYHYAHHTIT